MCCVIVPKSPTTKLITFSKSKMEGGSYQKGIFVNMSIESIWRMKELTLTVPQVPWFLKTVKFFLVVASIPGRKSSGMSSERSWNFKSPFGSSLAVISRKALDGLIIVPSSPVSIPATKCLLSKQQQQITFQSHYDWGSTTLAFLKLQLHWYHFKTLFTRSKIKTTFKVLEGGKFKVLLILKIVS